MNRAIHFEGDIGRKHHEPKNLFASQPFCCVCCHTFRVHHSAAIRRKPRRKRGQQQQSEPIVVGVSGPLTGPNAQYGAAWKKGFDLAIEEINGKGGVRGRKLAYEFQDTQADPKQTVIVAQKFVADPRIVIELGDFSSTASMAASSIYQRAGLVQFGFTNSNPAFTDGGDFMWSSSVTQKSASPVLADFAKELGVSKVAVMHLNTDWGKASHDLFAAHAQEIGLDVVSVESYAADEKNFADTLTRVREAKPDGMVLFSYQTDGAQIAQQMAKLDLKLPIIAGASLQSPQFVALAGKAAEGAYIKGEFFPDDPRPEVQTFVKAYQSEIQRRARVLCSARLRCVEVCGDGD